ncbi:SpoIID/LytB domain-containing protein [Actinomadura parmotrematis]|uniref:Peptidase inhibitor family I36 protein n=1 Tax=Actinomadura parmotrematis TaxID=2864039 RepID=A0ABS7FS66_9ACTN|nr:SpoIID/LytB domain-containing protein [Actinomadura parmotrematis]MBW8483146.1 peptidase inhibitor family I36 protein [Actinomadura parmotrematis]
MAKRTTRLIARLAAATLAAALGGTALAAAPAASAAGRNGVCEAGEFCLYFNSGQQGSVSDFTGSVADYGAKQPSCFDFKGSGAGKGRCVKNAAASVWNRSSKTVRVYFNSDYGGTYQDFKTGAKGNLSAALKNQNASHRFSPATTSCKTDGTNGEPPTSILVYRVSLQRVDRVAFKTYVKNVLPNEWVPSWPRESLRAGAVAVKSYGWYWALHSAARTPWGQCYDVKDTTANQVYRPGSALAATSAAVDATWATRMTRGGRILEAHYCSTSTACGGWVTGDWLSQYGSRDHANAGWTHAKILKSYYAGIALSS